MRGFRSKTLSSLRNSILPTACFMLVPSCWAYGGPLSSSMGTPPPKSQRFTQYAHAQGPTSRETQQGVLPQVVVPSNGIIEVSRKNYLPIVRSNVPIVFVFYSKKVEPHKKYVEEFCHQVSQIRKTHSELANKFANASEAFQGHPLVLGLVDSDLDPTVLTLFHLQYSEVPVALYFYCGAYLDRMNGLVPDIQIKDSLNAFVKFVDEEVQKTSQLNLPKSQLGVTKLGKVSEDEENVMTLLHVASVKQKTNDLTKAHELYKKAHDLARSHIQNLKKQLGMGEKKLTAEMLKVFKADPNVLGCGYAMAGLATVAFTSKRTEEAVNYCRAIREEFPWQLKESREVAAAVCEIEMYEISKCSPSRENVSLIARRDDLDANGAEFYDRRVKLAVLWAIDQKWEQAIEECLRLVRSEPKLWKELQEHALIGKDANPRDLEATPARKILRLVFELLGDDDSRVVDARKSLHSFVFV